MTDRELLERAAKAAGIELGWDALGPYERIDGVAGGYRSWSPLDDDGDALRLAVQLGMNIIVLREGGCIVKIDGVYRAEELGDDPRAATRRAIVRAAAALNR